MTSVPDVPDRPSDLELVRAVVRRDDGAFEALRSRTAGIVGASLARALAKRSDLALDREDLLQSFYLFLLEDDCRVLETYRGRSALTTWMHSVAIRYFYRQTSRRHARHLASPDGDEAKSLPSESPSPEDVALATARVSAVRGVMAELGDEDRAMLRLLYEQGVSATVVGEALSMSGAAVRMRKKRLFERLASKLKELRP